MRAFLPLHALLASYHLARNFFAMTPGQPPDNADIHDSICCVIELFSLQASPHSNIIYIYASFHGFRVVLTELTHTTKMLVRNGEGDASHPSKRKSVEHALFLRLVLVKKIVGLV